MPTNSSTTAIAVQSGTVAVEIQQVPNQPIQFMVLFHLHFSGIDRENSI